MGGVDLADQMLALYQTKRKALRYRSIDNILYRSIMLSEMYKMKCIAKLVMRARMTQIQENIRELSGWRSLTMLNPLPPQILPTHIYRPP